MPLAEATPTALLLNVVSLLFAAITYARARLVNWPVGIPILSKPELSMSSYLTDYRQHVGVKPDKFYKTTLFRGNHLMLGLNCLEPGQVQSVHDHASQDKFYAVLEGVGLFTVGEAEQTVGPGVVVWAPAGLPHGVRNEGSERLVLLMGIAPPP